MSKNILKTFLIIILFVACSAAVAKWSTYGQETEKKEDEPAGFTQCENPNYDTEKIEEWFPGLKEVKGCTWEYERVADKNKRTPGKTDIHARGQISVSEKQAEQYLEEYQWEPDEPHIATRTFYSEGYRSEDWKSSTEFEKDVMSEDAWGNMWFDGKNIWFEILY